MPSLNEFSIRITKTAKGMEKNTNLAIKQLALAIDQSVVLATPVDTGLARSGWILSLSNPATSPKSPFAPLPRRRDTTKKSEAGNARGAINQAKTAITPRKPEQTIFISNNVEYIGTLNETPNPRFGGGWSAQAPQYFVQEAIKEAISALRKSKVLK